MPINLKADENLRMRKKDKTRLYFSTVICAAADEEEH